MNYRPIEVEELLSLFVNRPSKLNGTIINLVDEINLNFELFRDKTNPQQQILARERFQKLNGDYVIEIMNFAEKTNNKLTIETAERIINHSNSYTRGKYLAKLHSCVERNVWFEAFFNNWPMIEIGDPIIDEMKAILKNEDFPSLMKQFADPSCLESYENMPEKLLVYRGCSDNSLNGLSWSTDIEVAKFFALRRLDLYSEKGFMFYRIMTDINDPVELSAFVNRPKEKTYLLHGYVDKKDCLFFGSRGEIEIFSTKVELLEKILCENREDVNNAE